MVLTPHAGASAIDRLPRPTDEWLLAAVPPVALVADHARGPIPVIFGSGWYRCCSTGIAAAPRALAA